LAKIFKCTEQAVFYALEKLKIKRKKHFTYHEKSEEKHSKYTEKLSRIPQEKRVFVNKHSFTKGIRPFLL